MNRNTQNPFPGMNPYLESPAHWPSLHSSLIYCCHALLNATLPEEFRATLDENLYVLPVSHVIRPDVFVRRVGEEATSITETATDAYDKPIVIFVPDEEVREGFVEIVSEKNPGRIIAVIEILSPTNKLPGKGRDEYQRKQREYRESGAHLLEIDLLRDGPHTVLVPAEGLRESGLRWDYIVSLHRVNCPNQYEAWAFTVRDRLPRLPIPLTDEYPDTVLDLQAAFDRAYVEGAYARARNLYIGELVPPLSPGDRAWAEERLREAGFRESNSVIERTMRQ